MPSQSHTFRRPRLLFPKGLDYALLGQEAERLWAEFLDRRTVLDSTNESDIAEEMLYPRAPVSIYAVRFAHFCKDHPRRPEHAPDNPSPLQSIGTQWLPPVNKYGRFTGYSWIYHRDEHNVEVHFNRDILDRGRPSGRRLASILLLRQIGHLYTAWPLLHCGTVAGYARECTGEINLQGIWFCSRIVSLALGALAANDRRTAVSERRLRVVVDALASAFG